MKTNRDVIIILGAIGGLLTGYIAILTYLNAKEHRLLSLQNAHLDQELKVYELELKKNKLKDL